MKYTPGLSLALVLALSACAYGGGEAPKSQDAAVADSASSTSADAAFAVDAESAADARSLAPDDAGPDATLERDAMVDRAPTVPDACARALSETHLGLESDDEGWTTTTLDGVSGDWPFNPWALGGPELGPTRCPEGERCLATGVSENYPQCGRADVRTRSFDLSACSGIALRLEFEHYYAFWEGEYGDAEWRDGGLVEYSVDGGSSWQPLDLAYSGTIRINPDLGSGYSCLSSDRFYVHGRSGFVGRNEDWQRVTASLPDEAATDALRVRFAWASGVSTRTRDAEASRAGTAPGWFIDALRVVVADD